MATAADPLFDCAGWWDPADLSFASLRAVSAFRLALLDSPSFMDAAWGAVTFAAVAAIGAGALRAVALPSLVGPALMTLQLYLWSLYMRRPRALGGDRRRIAEAGALALLVLLVLGWNLLLVR